MAMVAPCSAEFWPGAVVPLSMATISATVSGSTADAPTPTSSRMVNRK